MMIKIGKELDGKTVRELLADTLELSRRAVCALKNNERGIVLNSQRVTVRAVVSEGDLLELALEDNADKENDGFEVIPVDLPIDVIYEDEAFTVVNKPAGMPTIISHGHYDDTLANALAYRYRDKGFVMRAVNRLDRDTSGICIVANSRRSAHILGEQMKGREMRKKYVALLDGSLEPFKGERTIKNRIKRMEGSTIMREVTEAPLGNEAETVYSLLLRGKSISAVTAEPRTGRTHQLRVHFSHIGFPIVGDTMYGKENALIDRQALHAYEMTLMHPYTKELMTFRAKIPSDIALVASADGIDLSELI